MTDEDGDDGPVDRDDPDPGDGPATDGGPTPGDDTAGEGTPDGDSPPTFLHRLDAYPLFEGLIGGVASFLVGYLLVFALILATGTVRFADGAWTVLRVVGYRFYNTLHVPTYLRLNASQVVEYSAPNGTVVGEQQVVLITEQWQNNVTGTRTIRQRQYVNGDLAANGSQMAEFDPGLPVPELVYLAVPVLALLAVGYLYGDRLFAFEEWDPNVLVVQSLAGGLALTLGYLLVALAGTYVFVETGSGGRALLRPARYEALVSGVAYPLVAGTVGVAVGQLSRETFEEARERASENGDTGS